MLRIPVEGKSLPRNARYAIDFAVSVGQELLDGLQGCRPTREIQQVSQRFQGVINFMSDGMRELPGSGHLLCHKKGVFGELAVGDIRQHRSEERRVGKECRYR